jgi:lipoprotein-anchoring transpeptidase ErfK/SrfK
MDYRQGQRKGHKTVKNIYQAKSKFYCNLYSSSNIIMVIKSRMRWTGHKNAHMLVRKPQRKIPLRKSTCKWEDNTEIPFNPLKPSGNYISHLL